jgi:hypothetical protein
MASAKLVLTDALIAEALRRGKDAERQARQETDDAEDRRPRRFTRTRRKDRRAAQHGGE